MIQNIPNNPMDGSSTDFSTISGNDVLRVLRLYRKKILIATLIGCLLAGVLAWLTPNQYEATVRLMPPEQQNLPGASLLAVLSSATTGNSSAGSLLNSRRVGPVFIGVISSDTARNDLINRFNLQRVYGCKLMVDCRKILEGRTTATENGEDGIISIAVRDTDPSRAKALAAAYVQELDGLVNSLSTSSARREREFLEERIRTVKQNLDESSRALSQFSSKNATLNPQNQGQSLFEEAAKLQGDLVTAEAELSGLKAQYADSNLRVREVQARINELRAQLNKMGALGNIAAGTNGSQLGNDQTYPTIRELPILGVTYADLARQVAIQESIYETLTKQYELAKVEESKEIPAVKILDQPEVPERKSSPHRLIIVVIGGMLFAFGTIAWVFFKEFMHKPEPLASTSGANK